MRETRTRPRSSQIPHLLSVLATGTFNGAVEGLNELQSQYQKEYGPGNYVPDVFVQYWSMRVMAYLGTLVFLLAIWGGWLLFTGRLRSSRLFQTACVWAIATPFLMNTAGWLLTESGRQPWIVQGLQKTVNASSPSVSAAEIWISIVVLALVYIALGVADLGLMFRYSRRGLGLAEEEAEQPSPLPADAVPSLTY